MGHSRDEKKNPPNPFVAILLPFIVPTKENFTVYKSCCSRDREGTFHLWPAMAFWHMESITSLMLNEIRWSGPRVRVNAWALCNVQAQLLHRQVGIPGRPCSRPKVGDHAGISPPRETREERRGERRGEDREGKRRAVSSYPDVSCAKNRLIDFLVPPPHQSFEQTVDLQATHASRNRRLDSDNSDKENRTNGGHARRQAAMRHAEPEWMAVSRRMRRSTHRPLASTNLAVNSKRVVSCLLSRLSLRRCRRCPPLRARGRLQKESRFVFVPEPVSSIWLAAWRGRRPMHPCGNCSSRTWQDSGNSLGSSPLHPPASPSQADRGAPHPSPMPISLTNSSFPATPRRH